MRSLKTHSRKTALALVLLTAWSMYASGAEWQEGSTYTAGTTVTYQGRTYQALRTHTAYPGAGWTPSTTPTLWRDMRPATPAHRHRHRAGPGRAGPGRAGPVRRTGGRAEIDAPGCAGCVAAELAS